MLWAFNQIYSLVRQNWQQRLRMFLYSNMQLECTFQLFWDFWNHERPIYHPLYLYRAHLDYQNLNNLLYKLHCHPNIPILKCTIFLRSNTIFQRKESSIFHWKYRKLDKFGLRMASNAITIKIHLLCKFSW